MTLVYSRPKKLDHIHTVRYEIDMLRHAYRKLAKQNLIERDAWIYLETFLLHYRVLIEFLGKENPSPTDLNVRTIWKLVGIPEPAKLDEIHATGRTLLTRYEPLNSQGGGRISQYLQHCTTKRIDAKDWEVSTMMSEIEPSLGELEKDLVTTPGMLDPVSAITTTGYFNASTTVGTFTPAGTMIGEAPKKPKDFE
jgi:hypothetical protein